MEEMNDQKQPDVPQEPTDKQPQTDTSANSPAPETPRRNQRRPRVVLIAVVAVIICFLAGLAGASFYENVINNGELTQRGAVKNDGNLDETPTEKSISNVVSKVSPSVVSILTQSQGRTPYGPSAEEGAGTGVVVSKDGYILTNKHVVAGADTVSVVLSDGTTYDNVKVVGTDPLNDVAFLKVSGVNNLKVADIGDSTTIRVGQAVVAIGNSLGQYQNTVTSGIVSGTGRPISAQAGNSVENLNDLIQTDAAINPGNSGGPLLNLSGQVVGLNTAIVEGAQGIGFAIPINATKGLLKSVLEGKGVQRAYLGVNYIPITADVAKRYNLPVKKGAYVYNGSKTAIASGGPAAQAGIKDKDIITKVGGVDVGDASGVSTLVAEYAPGDTIEITILRGGNTMTVRVTLAAYKG